MPKAKIDNSKPDDKFPAAFRPGGGVVVGFVEMVRDDVRWQVLGYDDDGRLWCKGPKDSTGWLAPGPRTSTSTRSEPWRDTGP